MNHASFITHPCTWCLCRKNALQDTGLPRTLANCANKHDAWQKAGSKMKNARDFENCINAPIISTQANRTLLDIIPPSELHLLIGVINKIVTHMQQDFEDLTNQWLKICNVQRETTRSGSHFNGNSSKILLDKLDQLRAICPLGCLKYVDTLKAFGVVVSAFFGINIKANTNECINEFQKHYLELQITVTPKVFHHVKEFCSRHREGLGYYGEQAMESVHHDFKAVWARYCTSEANPTYSARLLNAVIEYNSLHV